MDNMPWYVKIAMAAFVFLLMGSALAASYATGDTSNRSIIIGAIIASFSSVVGFYFGSSDSSQKKDAVISAANLALSTSTPITAATTTTEIDAKAGTATTVTES